MPVVTDTLEFPESALLLGGFTLAHAAWSISDGPCLLCPLAIIQRSGERKLIRFEAASQQEAIERGKSTLANLKDDAVTCWAFAREGLYRELDVKTDVLTIELWSCESSRRLSLLERFEPYAKRQRFRLLGHLEILLEGQIQEQATVLNILRVVRRGVSEHSKVAPLWHTWRNV